jgi:NADH-quinone oxidoreductase subunit G
MTSSGKFEEVSWSKALAAVAARFKEVKARSGKFGVIASTRTTNEENHYLQEFARRGLGTSNIDHHRTGDVVSLLAALRGRSGALAATADLYERKAVLVVASDLAQQHPLLAFQIRANWRHHEARVYVVTRGPVREDAYAARSVRAEAGQELAAVESLRETLKAEPELVILFGDAIRGRAVQSLVEFGDSLGIPVKYVCLVDYSNSRGAIDSEVGFEPGLSLPEMLAAPDLDALWVIGANPLKNASLTAANAFVVVQDLFLTETARQADIVLPAASAYEKSGTVTNVCGEVVKLTRAITTMGTKPDLEIFRWLAREMEFEIADAAPKDMLGIVGPVELESRPDLIRSAGDTLFTSGTLGRYSKVLGSLTEAPGGLYR